MTLRGPIVAIIDYKMGNLFSIKQACEHVGLNAIITADTLAILRSDAIILPGVGAFGVAMDNLKKIDIIDTIKDFFASGKPLLGICLGMQLLMSESTEFGHHKGLDIIPGRVVRFDCPKNGDKVLKVPQVQWNRMYRIAQDKNDSWRHTLLDGIPDGFFMYFVHSFYVKPDASSVVLSISNYGDTKFCSALHYKNIYAFQGHPERSGTDGLKIYYNLSKLLHGEAPVC